MRRAGQLGLLSLAAFAALFARAALGPLQESLRLSLRLTDNQLGLLQGPALALPMLLLGVPIGRLIDRRSRVRLLIALAAASVVGSLMTAFAGGLRMLFIARCVLGLTSTSTGTAAFSLIADQYAPHERGRATMAIVVGQYAGIAAAFAAGGLLQKTAVADPDHWRAALCWMTVPLIVCAIALLALREPARTASIIAKPTLRETWLELRELRAVILPVFAGLIALQMAMQPALVWAAPILSRQFALQPERIGAIVAIGVLASGILGSIAGGLVADSAQMRGGPRVTLGALCVLGCLCIPLACFALLPSAMLAGGVLALFLTIVCALEVAGSTLFIVIVPNELRGTCVSMLAVGVMVLAVGVSPVLVSAISAHSSGAESVGHALSTVGALASCIGAAAFALARRAIVRGAGLKAAEA